ncbi:UvrD-helicase domain-containing protein [Flexivirga endophytica]|nr:UvrD-helicase domain-containing protein [Flexivirga endophytica]
MGWHILAGAALRERTIDRAWPWSVVAVPAEAYTALGGLNRETRRALDDVIGQVIAEADRLERLSATFIADGHQVQQWREGVLRDLDTLRNRWIPRELAARWLADRPDLASPVFDQVRSEPELAGFLATQPASLLQAIHTWEHTDIPIWVAERNQEFLAVERVHMKNFFDTIEKSPLTEEQISSVAMCDNSVRVIAAAGSGKTSTMVARAGYTLARGIAEPGQILMLAFNKAAADELHQRVVERLHTHRLDGEQIKATTFHSFGLEVIGQATGRKPRVPGDLVDLNGAKRMERVVDRLRDRDETFRRTWDLFRLVFGQPLSDFGVPGRPEDHDKITGIRGYRTLNDEVVKSQEERLIANWLFYHGVRYEYERPYEVGTATARHGQYHPDFYYPDIDAYHEHWAIDRDGNPPPTFEGYREGMRWKRQMHQAHGTTLLETTSASVRDGSGFDYLATQLRARGLVIDDSYHEIQHIPGREPVEDASIIRLFRTVLAHAKSNQLSSVDLRQRAASATGRIPIRTELFLQLYRAIHQEWQRQLAAANQVDFDDMLKQASEIIEAGRWANPYTMVLVDELQDSSCARAWLVRALTAGPDRHLLGVGDDWQAINRFAGADLSVMTDFATWFGQGPTVHLSRTFRSPQSLCDVAGEFVAKNPAQLEKQVSSVQREDPPTLQAIAVNTGDEYPAALEDYLTGLSQQHAGDAKPASVFVLGRYRHTLERVADLCDRSRPHLTVSADTIHKSKGKEADYVVVLDLISGAAYSFPSTIEDDPLLRLAQPGADRFPDAEERRLFYVALTRARKAVLLLTTKFRESTFLMELFNDKKVTIHNRDGETDDPIPCPDCRVNPVVLKSGSNGDFYGCVTWPACNGKYQTWEIEQQRESTSP